MASVPTVVLPSIIFNSAVVDVTPSKILSSVAVVVTATSSFILGDVSVLLVNVSVDSSDTKVESPPAGNVRTLVTPAECACAFNVCPCELFSQLNIIDPELVLPLTSIFPVPCGANFIFLLLALVTML